MYLQMKLLKWWNFQLSSVKHIQSLFNCSEFWHFKVIVTFSYITSKLMHITSTLSYITLEVELFYFSKRNVSGVPVHKSLCLSVCLFFSFFHYFEWVFYQGKGQNVENHFIESQKKNIESLKFEKDQNIESIFRTSKGFWATTYGILPICSKACGGLG
jgi:hypothetical protein